MLKQILRPFRKSVPRVCFVHVPKCAGTATVVGIRKSMGFANRLTPGVMYRLNAIASNMSAQNLGRPLHEHRNDLLHYALCEETHRYVHGHFACSLELLDIYRPDWKFITVLRPPEQRLKSHYFFNRYKKSDHFSTDLSIDEWLDSPMAISNGTSLLNLFGQGDPDRALKTLNAFDIVGDISQLSEFSKKISDLFGHKIVIPIRNTSPAKVSRELTSSQAQKVKDLCRVDTMIYNKFWKIS